VLVSILARSGDRALHLLGVDGLIVSRFQSSPGLVTGRYPPCGHVDAWFPPVSILARSGDRALRAAVIVTLILIGLSSPGLVTGRYLASDVSKQAGHRFQSSPGLVTGRYHQSPISKMHKF